MDEEIREHRPDETAEQQTVRESTESAVGAVEHAADKGRLSRAQAERVIGAGRKAIKSHDLSHGIRGFDR